MKKIIIMLVLIVGVYYLITSGILDASGSNCADGYKSVAGKCVLITDDDFSDVVGVKEVGSDGYYKYPSEDRGFLDLDNRPEPVVSMECVEYDYKCSNGLIWQCKVGKYVIIGGCSDLSDGYTNRCLTLEPNANLDLLCKPSPSNCKFGTNTYYYPGTMKCETPSTGAASICEDGEWVLYADFCWSRGYSTCISSSIDTRLSRVCDGERH